MILRPYIDREGRNAFDQWFRSLEATSRARVSVYLDRLERGNLSNIKSVGGGVMELRMDFGPGFRAYLGRDGETLVILLGGGSKKASSAILPPPKACGASTRQRRRSCNAAR